MYTITQEIQLDAGHRIPDHASKCRNIHGHRYRVFAEVEGPLIEEGSEKGMVMDFGFLKKNMMDVIHDPTDHRLILSSEDTFVELFLSSLRGPRGLRRLHGPSDYETITMEGVALYVIAGSPTAENLAEHWFHRLAAKLKASRATQEIVVKELTVHETPNCRATYKS